MFKEQAISSVAGEAVAESAGVGTQGVISRVRRDNTSLERFVGSIRLSAEQLLDLRVRAHVFNLGPDTDDAGDIWFPYVMSLISLLRPATHYVVDGIFDPRKVVDTDGVGRRDSADHRRSADLRRYLLRYLSEQGITMNLGARRGLLVTGGGWKTHSDEEIDSGDFRAWCAGQLGLDAACVRDAYNMVELNTVVFECEAAHKHIPPWLIVEALDSEAQQPVSTGEMGVLAYWDALPTGYPGFVISDDFGVVDHGRCECGREPDQGLHPKSDCIR